MGRYVIRRLLQLIPVVFGTTLLIYYLVWGLPGNPFLGKCGPRPCPPAFIAQKTAEFNLDDPFFIQYFKYIGKLLTGDFGETFSGQSVVEQLQISYPITLRLAIVALIIEAVFGILFGVIAGIRRGKFIDNLLLVFSLIFLSLPVFVTGFFLQYLLGVKWQIINPTVSFSAPIQQLIVPGFVLGSLSLAYITRLTRGSVAENLRGDFVRTARAKGLAPSRVVGVHLLRNSLIPVVTFIGTDLGALMGGAIVTEGIFNIQGIGNLVYTSIKQREATTTVAVITVLVLVYLLMNLLVDLLYAVLDPRIRYD